MKKIAVITGASSGMGAEFAKQIAALEEEDAIWIVARRLEKLEALAEEINKTRNFATVVPVALDISGKEGVHAFKKLLDEENEKLALMESGIEITKLVNNAGFGTYGPFEESDVDREMEMTDLNCTSLVGLTGGCLPFMKKGSLIINTASLASFLPLGEFAVYGATKSYVLSFSMALAAELKDKGIKVCALCPGPVSTEFANVASGGIREKVRHGLPADKVVAHCLKKALKGKRIAIYAFKWKFKAAASRFIGRYIGARFTFKYCKRPHPVPQKKEISPDDFLK
ncbi:MAG: SDR family NAD(P)-dependent oxidoreductase [Treponema sp.]|nr:SDR family NAD(P)-dependent oxidoreductase [Treponema sp.]